MTIDNGDELAVWRKVGHKGFDVGACRLVAARTCPLSGGPSGIQAICGCHGQYTYVATAFTNHTGGLDCLRRDCSLIGNYNFAIGPGFSQPIGPINGTLAELVVDTFAGLFNRVGGQAQVASIDTSFVYGSVKKTAVFPPG